jgi:hypothetical protein
VVTTAEELPVVETLDLLDLLGATVPVAVAAVVVNRVLPELFTRDEEELFTALRAPAAVETLARATDAAGEDVAQVLDAAALAVALRRERAANLATLQERLRPGLGVVLVPELFARSHGKRAVMQVAEALAEELS